MYELTKVYKSKAMAINAIRMTANNKGWKVLSTEEAAEHVWPQAEGFAVNNTTLNVALGFIEPEVAQKVPAGSVTSGAALEAANAALAEQAKVDAATPVEKALQKSSKLEESKKQAKADKKAAKNNGADSTEPKQTRCNVVNGARRPLRGKTLLVWETTERLYNELGEVPSMKQVHEELLKTEPGFNKTTTGIQYYACRAYNAWESTKGSK